MTGDDLFKNVYRIVRKIPSGRVTTYGQIARLVQEHNLSLRKNITPRIVGFALHANKDPEVPCHRVVNKDGRLAPGFAFSAKSDESRILGGPATNRSSRPVRRVREVSLGGDGWREQKRRLESEGVRFKDKMHVDLEKYLWVLK